MRYAGMQTPKLLNPSQSGDRLREQLFGKEALFF